MEGATRRLLWAIKQAYQHACMTECTMEHIRIVDKLYTRAMLGKPTCYSLATHVETLQSQTT